MADVQNRLRSIRLVGVMLAVAALAAAAIATMRGPAEVGFAAANAAAMARMMKGMSARSSGSVDRDVAVSMIAHHQGAIDMAIAELRFGSNERLRRIAQAIVVDQQQEIAAMRLVVDEELSLSATALAEAPRCRSSTLSDGSPVLKPVTPTTP